MRNHFVFTLLLFSMICLGQTKKKSYAEKINHPAALNGLKNIEEARERAKKDFQQESIVLYLETGIKKLPKPLSKTDQEFENDYNLFYSPTGCLIPEDEYIIAYNYVIFDYFTEKYGKDWMTKIRKDTIGFEEYKSRK